MFSRTDWQNVLKERFAVYDIEQSLYKWYMGIVSTPRAFAQAICDNMKPTDVPFNLQWLYCEAIYGSDPKVRARIFNRMNTIQRSIRYLVRVFYFTSLFQLLINVTGHAFVWLRNILFRNDFRVKDVDMLHASDYASMNLNQLCQKLSECKKKDNSIVTSMRYCLWAKSKITL